MIFLGLLYLRVAHYYIQTFEELRYEKCDKLPKDVGNDFDFLLAIQYIIYGWSFNQLLYLSTFHFMNFKLNMIDFYFALIQRDNGTGSRTAGSAYHKFTAKTLFKASVTNAGSRA